MEANALSKWLILVALIIWVPITLLTMLDDLATHRKLGECQSNRDSSCNCNGEKNGLSYFKLPITNPDGTKWEIRVTLLDDEKTYAPPADNPPGDNDCPPWVDWIDPDTGLTIPGD